MKVDTRGYEIISSKHYLVGKFKIQDYFIISSEKLMRDEWETQYGKTFQAMPTNQRIMYDILSDLNVSGAEW